ncbi:MAG TPA: hypothetical protein VK477_04515 [Acidobacteriota bacterium]|nr:hypothetical protein [Acidobacteriota bacterium]
MLSQTALPKPAIASPFRPDELPGVKPRYALSGIVGLLAASLVAQAGSSELAQVIRERDATLLRLVTYAEELHRTGVRDDNALFAARLALTTFRRDVARTPADKIAQQKLIVGWQEERLASVKARKASGTLSEEDLLRATDELLAAKQVLLELSEPKESPAR